jgi:two-component sensor histidine kinase
MRFLILFLCFVWFISCSEEHINYSLKTENNSIDYLYLDSIYKRAKQKTLGFNLRKNAINKLIYISDSIGIDSLNFKYRSYKTALFGNARQYDSALGYTYKLLHLAKHHDNSKYLKKSYSKLARYYKFSHQLDSSFHYYYKVRDEYLKANDSIAVAKTNMKLANLRYAIGDYYAAERLTVSSLDMLGTLKNKRALHLNYMQLAVTSNAFDDNRAVKTWLDKALLTSEKAIDSSNVYNSFGINAIKNKDFVQAKKYLQIAMDLLADDTKYPVFKEKVLDNYLFVKGLLGEDKALHHLIALDIERKLKKDFSGQLQSSLHLAELYTHFQNRTEAIAYAEKAQQLASKLSKSKIRLKALGLLVDLKPNSTEEGKLYKVINDSILKSEQVLKHTFNKIEYEVNEKIKESARLKQENILKAQELGFHKRQKEYVFIALLFALVAIIGIAYYSKKLKRQKQLVENLQREMHHRVKNNLAVIDTFIEIAKEDINPNTIELKLSEIQHRIDSINEVHQQLYNQEKFTDLNVYNYIKKLVLNLETTFNQPEVEIKTSIAKTMEISASKAFAFGLVVNEFVTNSFKYAFPDGNGQISIAIKQNENEYVLALSDNGCGLPDDFDIDEIDSFGMRIMKLLSEQLNGSFELHSSGGLKTEFKVPK